jgi:hypothetical protein
MLDMLWCYAGRTLQHFFKRSKSRQLCATKGYRSITAGQAFSTVWMLRLEESGGGGASRWDTLPLHNGIEGRDRCDRNDRDQKQNFDQGHCSRRLPVRRHFHLKNSLTRGAGRGMFLWTHTICVLQTRDRYRD